MLTRACFKACFGNVFDAKVLTRECFKVKHVLGMFLTLMCLLGNVLKHVLGMCLTLMCLLGNV